MSDQPTIDPALLEILACPETHQPLHLASDDELGRANARIDGGDASNQGGKPVSDRLDAGLVREDGKRIYPIKDGIPVLLVDEGIEL